MFSFDVFETYLFLSSATVFKVIYHVDKIIDKKMKYKNCSITTPVEMDFHLQFEKGLAGTIPTEGRGKPLLHWCLLLLLAHSKFVAFVSTIFF